MANTQSAKKRIRQNRTRRLKNRMVRTRTRSTVRQARLSTVAKEKAAGGTVLEAIRQLDKAASKGVIHKNNAARRKSRLLRQVRKTASGS